MKSNVSKYQKILPGLPLVESPFFENFANELWSGEDLRIARDLNINGYSIVNFSDYRIFELMDGIKRDFHKLYEWDKWRSGALDSLRIQDAWAFDKRVEEIASNKIVLRFLQRLYGRRAFPFQTLNFAVGTQQASHSDHVHFSSAPERFMCGVWLAFEDIDAENGPLFYYPGSHKWLTLSNESIGVSNSSVSIIYEQYGKFVDAWEELAKVTNTKREIFKAKAGQALIWSSNLVHGGSQMVDKKRTRWSQVSHYFFDDCAYTTPVANDLYHGQIYFRDLIDISTRRKVHHTFSGVKVEDSLINNMRPIFNGMDKLLPINFNSSNYLNLNPDVAAAGVDPRIHYIQFGKSEGRKY